MAGAFRIPLFDLNYGKEEEEALLRVLRSRWISQGPETEAFERDFARFTGSKYAVAVSNGTAALHLSYLLAGIKPGDEVIVPSFTFIATVTPLLWIGARPIFADIDSLKNLNISRRTVEPLVTKKTKAVVFVHFAGFTDGIEELKDFCSGVGCVLIEDASHAHGSRVKGKHAGTFGLLGAFSFFSNKNLAVGEGGMIITGSDEIYRKAKLLRSHGMTRLAWDKIREGVSDYDVVELGFNYRMNELQAALGRVQLRKLETANGKRRKLVKIYRETLKDVVLVPFEDYENSANYIFPIILPRGIEREEAALFLHDRGIQTSHHYRPVHLMSFFRKTMGTGEGLLPVTEEAGRRELTLPLYPGMREEDVHFVAESLREFIGR